MFNLVAPLGHPHSTHFRKPRSRQTMQNVVFLAQINLYIAADVHIKCMHRIWGCTVFSIIYLLLS